MSHALSCGDGRKYITRSSLARAVRAFSPTPPPSSDGVSGGGNSLLGTCRALQSLLNASPVSSSRRSRTERLQSPLHILSTPPAPPAARPPLIRQPPHKVTKPSSRPPRGPHKRTRTIYEQDSDAEMTIHEPRDRFSTPKRQKMAPSQLPLGLAISDFESLGSPMTTRTTPTTFYRLTSQFDENERSHLSACDPQQQQHIIPSIEHPDREDRMEDEVDHASWTTEDDQRLVEIVLEKFKLSKRDWEECARRIGKDNDSVGKRWKALVGEGNVGLRRGKRFVRGQINESWR